MEMRSQDDDPTSRTRVHVRLATVAAVVWAGLIFAASSVPGSAVPGRFGDAAHVIEYAILGILLVLARREPTTIECIVMATAFASAWGATDELHQAFVPLRVPDVGDWLRDTIGALAGASVTAVAGYLRARRPLRS